MSRPLIAQGTTRAWLHTLGSGTANAARWYDLLGGRVLGLDDGQPMANMGLWRDAGAGRPSSLAEASVRLWDMVAMDAGLGPDTAIVLDAGCGFGLSTARWVGRWGVQQAIGLNVSAHQLAWARAHVDAHGGKVCFVEADATAIPRAEASVDAVVSVEAAFHFDTRKRFLAQAARVLRPGGRLAMVDLLAEPPRGRLARLLLTYVRHGVQSPAPNVCTVAELDGAVRAAGLTVERLDTIEADVIPPFRRWFFSQPWAALLRAYHPVMMVGNAGYFLWPWRYVRLVARRPG